ncbi:hypothetical protein HHI36_019412 [Cryptolaemus montrouzieri]|uniref:Choline transporter-like protein n=1 Tax=Cryptolaemus montrouzieri TaxID=559131 RepID=A0ABD2P357_9CUCU
MGNKSSSPPKAVEPPVALHVFKCLDGVPMEYSIPEVPEKRKPTDRFFLILFIVMYAALGVLTIYMMMYSDLKRTTNGYDNCGNVCGEKNDPVDGINCTGKDYTNENILMYERDSALVNLDNLDMEPSECVENCEEFGYLRILNRCFKISDFDDDKKEKAELELVIDMQVIKDLQASLGHIVGMVFIALGICFIILLLFKYFVSIMVKSIVISTVILSVGLAIYMWCFKTEYSTTAKWFVLIYCIIICVGAALSWRKINFVIRIFNETTKAVFDMPSLMLIPIWVFLIEIILIGLFIFLMIMYTTSGVLTHLYGPYYTYSLTSLMMFTIVYTLFMFLYSGAFLGGCQQVVVSGAISTWYFTREKDNILGSPVADSLRILTRYHLGSVAFGSLVISVMKFIRLAIKGMLKKKEFVCFRLMMNLCLDFVEEFIHYVSNQAYIMQCTANPSSNLVKELQNYS